MERRRRKDPVIELPNCFHFLQQLLEWDLGFGKRFGLIEVNYETQERKLRDGSKLFVDIVKRHRQGDPTVTC